MQTRSRTQPPNKSVEKKSTSFRGKQNKTKNKPATRPSRRVNPEPIIVDDSNSKRSRSIPKKKKINEKQNPKRSLRSNSPIRGRPKSRVEDKANAKSRASNKNKPSPPTRGRDHSKPLRGRPADKVDSKPEGKSRQSRKTRSEKQQSPPRGRPKTRADLKPLKELKPIAGARERPRSRKEESKEEVKSRAHNSLKPKTKSQGKKNREKSKSEQFSKSEDSIEKNKKSRKSVNNKSRNDDNGDKNSDNEMKKVVVKGLVPVDQHFALASKSKVLTEGGIVYAATLNQSNVANNNNKFYVCQVLEIEDSTNHFFFFTRWGRVGVTGQMAAVGPLAKASAISQYKRKILDKTKSGQYRVVEMNYEADDENEKKQEDEEKKEKTPEAKSALDPKVQELTKLIFDMKMMNRVMKEIGYDAKKMPLGKLAKSSIEEGYKALKGLMDAVKTCKGRAQIERYTNNFYSYIPHDFGFAKMANFILDTEKKISKKLEMLQSLQNIQVFTKILDDGKIDSEMNYLDSNYLKLTTEIKPLPKDSKDYKILVDYVINTHAETHKAYKLEVQEIYTLSKESENARFRDDIENKQLLWHGSRLTNFVGILSQGLRIAPPEAPATGYMFGKGVYFADMVTKSANYCFSNHDNNTGLMLLCEVALGGMNELKHSDYYANLLPEGKHSTKGLGKTAPLDGIDREKVYIPCGKCGSTNIPDTTLMYNEFIVYDVAQIKSRYLFKMKFNYNFK